MCVWRDGLPTCRQKASPKRNKTKRRLPGRLLHLHSSLRRTLLRGEGVHDLAVDRDRLALQVSWTEFRLASGSHRRALQQRMTGYRVCVNHIAFLIHGDLHSHVARCFRCPRNFRIGGKRQHLCFAVQHASRNRGLSWPFFFGFDYRPVERAHPNITGDFLIAIRIDNYNMIENRSVLVAAEAASENFPGILAGGNLNRTIHRDISSLDQLGLFTIALFLCALLFLSPTHVEDTAAAAIFRSNVFRLAVTFAIAASFTSSPRRDTLCFHGKKEFHQQHFRYRLTIFHRRFETHFARRLDRRLIERWEERLPDLNALRHTIMAHRDGQYH